MDEIGLSRLLSEKRTKGRGRMRNKGGKTWIRNTDPLS